MRARPARRVTAAAAVPARAVHRRADRGPGPRHRREPGAAERRPRQCGRTPEQTSTAMQDALLPARPSDDVALLVARTRALADNRFAARQVPFGPAAVADVRTRVNQLLSGWTLDASPGSRPSGGLGTCPPARSSGPSRRSRYRWRTPPDPTEGDCWRSPRAGPGTAAGIAGLCVSSRSRCVLPGSGPTMDEGRTPAGTARAGAPSGRENEAWVRRTPPEQAAAGRWQVL